MTDWRFPTAFSSWLPNDDGPEDRAYKRAYASGRLTMGHEVAAFEEEFAAYHGRRHAIAVNSGSSANLVAVAAILEANRDTLQFVNAPAIAWATTYAPFVQLAGAQFTLLDVDATWNAIPDWEKITYGSCIIVCSVLGNPADLAGYAKLSLKGKGLLFEDNCESLGARDVYGQLTGTLGDISTSSGFYSHQMSGIELGVILTDDDTLARLCRLLRNHGNEGWGAEDLEKQYSFTAFGYNVRPLETHAAVAREQLKKLDEFILERVANLDHFKDATHGLPIVHQKVTAGARPSPFGLAFTCEDREARARLAVALRAATIDCRLPTGGSFRKHFYGKPWADQLTPHADRIHDCGMFCGNAPWPIPDLIEDAVRVMRRTL